jgi:nucleotide-binding universal stress UspA family protein
MSSPKVVAFQRRSPRFGTILVPIDGSELSLAAAFKALEFARRMDARVVVFHSIPSYQYPIYVGGIPFEYPSEADYETQCRAMAQRYLDLVSGLGADMGVSVGTRLEFNPDPVQGILDAARQENCSLIYLSAHGRSGVSPLFLGSVAHKILTLAQIPVLLDRPTPEEVGRARTLMAQGGIEP